MPGACSVHDCDRPHYARGLCRTHWRRWQRTGHPLGRWRPRHCAVEGCDRPYVGVGLCAVHLSRRRHGRPMDAPVRPSNHVGRGHREALVSLVGKLQRLEVCRSPEEAVAFAALLLEFWPPVDPGLIGLAEPMLVADLLEPADRPFPPGSVWR